MSSTGVDSDSDKAEEGKIDDHSSSSASSSRFPWHMPPPPPQPPTAIFVPYQYRSITDSLLHEGQPVDTELNTAIPVSDFEFTPTPQLNRTFSAPLPHRMGSLRHPLSPEPASRPSALSSTGSSTVVSDDAIVTPLQSLTLELADSVQAAIQTLVHLSPPHLFDSSKEQYSGCTIQMPATSLTALLSSMRNLNYLVANVGPLTEGKEHQPVSKDFDIGELLQSTADLLSGQAAKSEVDLVLFHGDVGVKHVSVNGDAEGLGYVLSHVIRQILLIASRGDSIELGLQVVPQSPTIPGVHSASPNPRPSSPGRTIPLPSHGPLLCVFEITYTTPLIASTTPRAEANPFTKLAEDHTASSPNLDSILCRRLLHQQNVVLRNEGSKYTLSTLLQCGTSLPETPKLTIEEEAVRQPFPSLRLAREPTLEELSEFSDSLRGKKVLLYASLNSVFARHITNYLAAWGMDISHVAIEEDSSKNKSTDYKFVIIDDDVSVLRRELVGIFTLRPQLAKRPTLLGRAKSQPQVRQLEGLSPIIIHFTSLANYNAVRDVLSSHSSSPGLIVIPKPVGPRRFLTALHTTVNQPLIDPFFSPIANSPKSPIGGYFSTLSAASEAPFQPQPTPDVLATPAAEYFSKTTSGASGVVMQSPDGRPYGMYFEPPKGERRPSGSNIPKRKPTGRRTSSGVEDPPSANSSPPTRRPIAPPEPPLVRRVSESSDARSSRRKTLPVGGGEPFIAQGRSRASTITQKRPSGSGSPVSTPPKKPIKEEVVVPPINVLIVEDNPINQNILSMFLRKKKIKHETAKDGLEAVEQWRTGGFHLILMDIQLPVMDGIEATKEIRKLERNNNIGVFPSTPVGEHPRPTALEDGPVPSSPLRSSVIIVALTASSLQSDRVVALAAGCNDFLTKPVSLKWLEKKIVEWGCMQALIDFDGWRRWKGSDAGETRKGFAIGPQQAARTLAGRLRIDRKRPVGKPLEGTGPLKEAHDQLVKDNVAAAGTTQMDPPTEGAGLAAINEDSEGSPMVKTVLLPPTPSDSS